MKELSIEGKAKAYDELIKRLNKAREDVGGYTFKSVYDEVMSELAESEDEKFLRYLIDCCKDTIESDDKGLELSMVTTKRLFAWLEKQGEQKSTLRIDNSRAKVVFPFKAKLKSTGIVVTIYNGQLSRDGKEWIKYQSDKEDGCNVYEPEDLEPVCNVEQKPAWSEEDDEMLDSIIEEVRYTGDFPDYPTKEEDELYDECLAKVEWLKSLKDRYTWKPSELQMEALESATENCAYSEYQDCLRQLIEQLKILKE